ncbi:hypothetical protein Ocin01_13786 [Orchesella cincta]|uniref:Uncharacterized protein n=1 Tax=Orchesella cincta TaxID=48709 RepID=A0A1D2MIU0_ORCCI|nr:hypothetical protein Ocin01_13786 [Orchesella cincta]
MPIQKWKETVLYGCPLSHPVHRGCKEDQCGICNSRDIRDREFNALVDNPTGSDLVIQGKRKRTQRVP